METPKKKPRVQIKITKSSFAFHPSDYDKNARFLIGWPGYRTRSNKSGLGYVETVAELAHMEGVMIRWLMTGKFRTHNPFYLIAMAVMGSFYGGIPAILILHEVIVNGRWSVFVLLLTALPNIAIGLLLLVNLVLSILDRNGKSITGD
jgi:hypothetical protein